MDIDMVRTKKGKCFNCGGPHLVKDCDKPRKACKECNFLGGGHRRDCSQCCRVRQAASDWESSDLEDTPKHEHEHGRHVGQEDPRINSIKGHSWKEIRAFFRDIEDTEKKGKGKAT